MNFFNMICLIIIFVISPIYVIRNRIKIYYRNYNFFIRFHLKTLLLRRKQSRRKNIEDTFSEMMHTGMQPNVPNVPDYVGILFQNARNILITTYLNKFKENPNEHIVNQWSHWFKYVNHFGSKEYEEQRFNDFKKIVETMECTNEKKTYKVKLTLKKVENSSEIKAIIKIQEKEESSKVNLEVMKSEFCHYMWKNYCEPRWLIYLEKAWYSKHGKDCPYIYTKEWDETNKNVVLNFYERQWDNVVEIGHKKTDKDDARTTFIKEGWQTYNQEPFFERYQSKMRDMHGTKYETLDPETKLQWYKYVKEDVLKHYGEYWDKNCDPKAH